MNLSAKIALYLSRMVDLLDIHILILVFWLTLIVCFLVIFPGWRVVTSV